MHHLLFVLFILFYQYNTIGKGRLDGTVSSCHLSEAKAKSVQHLDERPPL